MEPRILRDALILHCLEALFELPYAAQKLIQSSVHIQTGWTVQYRQVGLVHDGYLNVSSVVLVGIPQTIQNRQQLRLAPVLLTGVVMS